jgi:antitoxin component YwqK of YwqJK toxin-antitoxin module
MNEHSDEEIKTDTEEYVLLDDKINGIYLKHHTDGQLRSRYIYIDGKIDGIEERWNINGQSY